MDTFDFGLQLRKLRESMGFSQGDVARRLKLTRSTISGYEGNTTAPSVDTLTNLALLFNVSTDYLLGLSRRKSIYLDDFDSKEQEAIIKMIENLREGFKTEK